MRTEKHLSTVFIAFQMLMPVGGMVALGLVTAGVGIAQNVISAKAGLVYFVQGRVSIVGGERLASGPVNRQLNKGEILSSEAGRAEMLLNPGTVLRIGDMTRLRMDNVELADTVVSIEAGSAVVTVSQIPKLSHVTIYIGGVVVAMKSIGVYRFDAGGVVDADGPRLRVFSGQAEASFQNAATQNAATKTVVKRGRAVGLPDVAAGDLLISRFDLSDADGLQEWAEKRSPPPPLVPLKPMICYSEPKGMEELKEYTKECMRPAGPSQAVRSIPATNHP